jgi:hypothetical protein
MDVTTLRIAATLASFATFIGICAWACRARNRDGFDEAAASRSNRTEGRHERLHQRLLVALRRRLTLVGIAACLLLLWVTARKKVAARSDNTTGHVWDEDLTEMNNPCRCGGWAVHRDRRLLAALPGAYPGPRRYEGELQWSTRASTTPRWPGQQDLEPLYAQFTPKAEELAGDAGAMAIGERLFMNNCAQCHGSDARGSKGFPNLADATGCTAAAATRSSRPSPRAASARCRRWPRPSAAPTT